MLNEVCRGEICKNYAFLHNSDLPWFSELKLYKKPQVPQRDPVVFSGRSSDWTRGGHTL